MWLLNGYCVLLFKDIYLSEWEYHVTLTVLQTTCLLSQPSVSTVSQVTVES